MSCAADEAFADLAGIGAGARGEVDVEGVGIGVVVQLHGGLLGQVEYFKTAEYRIPTWRSARMLAC